MASKIPTVLTAKTPYEDMVLYNNGQFSAFSRADYAGICKRFQWKKEVTPQKFDADDSDTLDLFEVQLMMESMGETKTHAELKAMIAEVDKDKTGTISFAEFLGMLKAPESGEHESAIGAISRQPKNRVFEEAAAALKEDPAAKDQIKKEYEERKRKAQLKAEVEAREKAEKEAEEKARLESKSKLADRLKAFDAK